MNLLRCDKGHFYDGAKYDVCPNCNANIKIDEADMDTLDDFLMRAYQKRRSVTKKICLNLAKWFIQTVLFSLIPLFFFMIIHWMFNLKETSTDEYIHELCPFTLVISSSIAIELAKEKYVNTKIKEVIFPAYLILLILFFMLYGATVVSFELKLQLQKNILDNMFYAVLLISGIHLVLGGLLQVLGGLYDE